MGECGGAIATIILRRNYCRLGGLAGRGLDH